MSSAHISCSSPAGSVERARGRRRGCRAVPGRRSRVPSVRGRGRRVGGRDGGGDRSAWWPAGSSRCIGCRGEVTVMSAVMIRTASSPMRDRCEPSSRRASTGSRRVTRNRARNCAPVPATSCRNCPARVAAVGQNQHLGVQQCQQLSRVVGLPGGGWARHRAQHRPGAGLDQGHRLDHRVAGGAERRP